MSMMDGRDDDAQPVYKDYWPPVALQGVSITADSKSKKASSNPVGSSNSAEVPEVKMKTWTEYARMDITTEERRNNFIEKTYQVYPSGTQNCLRFTQSFFAKCVYFCSFKRLGHLTTRTGSIPPFSLSGGSQALHLKKGQYNANSSH